VEEYREDWDSLVSSNMSQKVDEPAIRAYSMANYPDERA
jgi:Na+-transporting NADH:ubiquinone oxidoreductase subunit F